MTPLKVSPKELNSRSIIRNKFSKSIAEGPDPTVYDPMRTEYNNFEYQPKANNPPVAAKTSYKRFELSSDLKKESEKQKKFIKLFYNQQTKQGSRQSLPKLKFVKVNKN